MIEDPEFSGQLQYSTDSFFHQKNRNLQNFPGKSLTSERMVYYNNILTVGAEDGKIKDRPETSGSDDPAGPKCRQV